MEDIWSEIIVEAQEIESLCRVSGVEAWGMCILTGRFCAVEVMMDMRYEI